MSTSAPKVLLVVSILNSHKKEMTPVISDGVLTLALSAVSEAYSRDMQLWAPSSNFATKETQN